MVWTEQDAAQLREYLSTQSGERLLEKLQAAVAMPNATTLESEALNSRESKGTQKALDLIKHSREFRDKPLEGADRYYAPLQTRK